MSQSDPFSILLKNDKSLSCNEVVITCRHIDGYVNATELCKCKNSNADISQWRRLKGTNEFLDVLAKSLKKDKEELIVYSHGSNDDRSTWVHPQVAIEIAHWLSPEIKVKITGWIYELVAIGKAELKNESSITYIEQEWKQRITDLESAIEEKKLLIEQKNELICKNEEIKEKLDEEHSERMKITKRHQALLRRRRYYQFPTQNCLYIWRYPDGTHKVGITTDINERLATERTIAPDLKLIYIVYLKHARTLEQFMLDKFDENRLEANHEVIYGISSDELCYAVSRYLEISGHKYEIESHLLDYNQEDPSEVNEDVKAAVITNILNKEATIQKERVPCTWPDCPKTFTKMCHVYRHIRQVHERSEDVTCPECDQSFSCTSSLNSHIRNKHSQTKVKCSACEVELANKTSLRRHMLTVHSDQGKTACPVCKKLVTKTNLSIHIRRIHKKSIKFPCEYCGKTLASKLNLDNHIANVCRKRPSTDSSSSASADEKISHD